MGGGLFIVGIGPGDEKNMTLWAREHIEESEVVIGYKTYIDLIEHLVTGKEVISFGMHEEIKRASLAVKKAKEGKKVSIVSSGDAGIYGIAALVYEMLFNEGWNPGKEPSVKVIPGVTAASACAALVGSPLSSDFAVISMSDLLVPWETIERRIRAAAEGDFVIVIYNPVSKRRNWQLKRARDIIAEYRSPKTPVAIVKNAFRKGQTVEITTLDEMMNSKNLGMHTTIIVGNSTTKCKDGILLTPRGYSSKYDVAP